MTSSYEGLSFNGFWHLSKHNQKGSFSVVYTFIGSLYLLPHRHTILPINHTSHRSSQHIVQYRSAYLCVMLQHPYSLDTLCRRYQSPFLLIVVGSCFSSVYPIGAPYIRVCPEGLSLAPLPYLSSCLYIRRTYIHHLHSLHRLGLQCTHTTSDSCSHRHTCQIGTVHGLQ